jgi:hypothetical protein
MAWPKGKPRKAASMPLSITTESSNMSTAEPTTHLGIPSPGAPVVNITAEELDELARLRAENAAIKAKLELRTAVQTEVSEAMRLQQEADRRREFGKPTPATYVMPPKPDDAVMIAVKLEKNYAPIGYYETVGWDRPKIEKKGPGGVIVVIQEAAFIKDEKAPPAVAGTGYANKVWAGTTIKLPEEEAKHVDKVGIARRVFD